MDIDIAQGHTKTNFVRDLLGGKYAHSTQCKNCGHKSTRPEVFSQIELNIKDKAFLQDCLREYLKEELLCGSNQYMCSQCQSKQDAGRFTELRELPPVINFQLFRFVIDMESDMFRKKKITSLVRFPLELDMRPFMAMDSQMRKLSNGPIMYDLHAVLIHAGESAYSGHYIAHVYDHETGEWFRCNDESCGPLDLSDRRFMFDINPKDQEIFLGSPPKKSGSSSSKAKEKDKDASADGAETSNVYSSRNAYMLIYVKREHRDADMIVEITPPEKALATVQKSNEEFQVMSKNYQIIKDETRARFDKERDERLDIVSKWNLKSINDDCYYLPTSWLIGWMQSPISADVDWPRVKMEENVETGAVISIKSKEIALDSILCEHGKLSMSQMPHVKRISVEAAQTLQETYGYSIAPLVLRGEDALCRCCVEAEFHSRIYLKCHWEHIQHVARLLRLAEADKGDTVRNKKKSIVDTMDLVPKKSEEWIDVPENSLEGTMKWISKDWLSTWLKKNPNFDSLLVGNARVKPVWAVSPLDLPFREDVLCSHNRLSSETGKRRLVPESVWEFFKRLIPLFAQQLATLDEEDITSESAECPACLEMDDKIRFEKNEIKKRASSERNILKNLFVDARSLNFLVDEKDSSAFYLLSINFLDAWKRFVRTPETSDRPLKVDNRDLVCAHGKLKYSLDYFTDNGTISRKLNLMRWESNEKMKCPGEADEKKDVLIYRPFIPQPDALKTFNVKTRSPFTIITQKELVDLKRWYDLDGPLIRVAQQSLFLQDLNTDVVMEFEHVAAVFIDEKDCKSPGEFINPDWCSELCEECWSTWKNDWAVSSLFVRRHEVEGDVSPIVERITANRVSPRTVKIMSGSASEKAEDPESPPLPRRAVRSRGRANTTIIIDDTESEDDSSVQDESSGKRKHLQPGIASFVTRTTKPTKEEHLTSDEVIITPRKSRRVRQKGLVKLDVEKYDSVKDLKIKIMEVLGVTPIQQRLFYFGVEWTENNMTLAALDVLQNSVLDLVIVPDKEFEYAHLVREELGFAGTLLGGGALRPDSSTDSVIAISDPTPPDVIDLAKSTPPKQSLSLTTDVVMVADDGDDVLAIVEPSRTSSSSSSKSSADGDVELVEVKRSKQVIERRGSEIDLTKEDNYADDDGKSDHKQRAKRGPITSTMTRSRKTDQPKRRKLTQPSIATTMMTASKEPAAPKPLRTHRREWICDGCTIRNTMNRTHCAMCKQPRVKKT